MKTIAYNRKNATAYARRWALGRNPRFYDFTGIGGDCTNFVSQCLYAGSGVMNYTPDTGWYYRSLNDRAPAWTGVEFLYDFLINNKSIGPFARQASYDEARKGDVIQLGDAQGDFYHTLIIVQTEPEILIASHSNDALNRPLRTYDYAQARFLHIEGVRI
ncbi:MAG: amidase domain-containing protein [Clostridia bacterium]|nr:amidase domain-containing protein [Clostridia bacterium]